MVDTWTRFNGTRWMSWYLQYWELYGFTHPISGTQIIVLAQLTCFMVIFILASTRCLGILLFEYWILEFSSFVQQHFNINSPLICEKLERDWMVNSRASPNYEFFLIVSMMSALLRLPYVVAPHFIWDHLHHPLLTMVAMRWFDQINIVKAYGRKRSDLVRYLDYIWSLFLFLASAMNQE